MKALSSAVLCGALALGQFAGYGPQAIAQTGPPTLQDGTPIKLRLGRNLSSADARTGDTVNFEVLEEVRVNNVVVIPRNANALATITNAQPKGRMGRGGKLDVNIDSVRLTDGEKVPLRGVQQNSGGGHTGAMTGAIVATSLVAWPAAPLFLMMHGKDITMPEGTQITAFVNGDIPIDLSKFSGAPATSGAPGMAASYGAGAAANITSSVPGADVEVDGNYVGSTPAQVQIAAGNHTITVKKRGYKPWTRTMNVTGGNLNISADLESIRSGGK